MDRLMHAQDGTTSTPADVNMANMDTLDDISQRSLDALQNKNAIHRKWKEFLAPGTWGAGNTQIFALQDFLRQKVQHENHLTAALAEERLFIIDVICKNSYSRKQAHISALPRRTNFIILQTFKRMGRDLKNLVPIDAQAAAVYKMFYESTVHTASQDNNFQAAGDPNMLLGTLSGADKGKVRSILGIHNNTTAPAKPNYGGYHENTSNSSGPVRTQNKTVRPEPYQSDAGNRPQKQNPRHNNAPASNNTSSGDVEKHKNRYLAIIKGSTADKVNELVHCNKNLTTVDRAFWKTYCKNCFWDSKLSQHTLRECREAGNPCKITCPECNKQGKKVLPFLPVLPIFSLLLPSYYKQSTTSFNEFS
jgi:hypothetical protein